MSLTNALVSRTLQLQVVSSFQNTSVFLKSQVFVAVLNDCKCSKVTVSIGPGVIQVFSNLWLAKKNIPKDGSKLEHLV